MNYPDLFNSLLITAMTVCCMLSVRAIRRDRSIKGVHWGPTLISAIWGLWNLYYYIHLGQYISLCAEIVLASTNIVWLYYAYRILRNNDAKETY